jgi:hypothetical protein
MWATCGGGQRKFGAAGSPNVSELREFAAYFVWPRSMIKGVFCAAFWQRVCLPFTHLADRQSWQPTNHPKSESSALNSSTRISISAASSRGTSFALKSTIRRGRAKRICRRPSERSLPRSCYRKMCRIWPKRRSCSTPPIRGRCCSSFKRWMPRARMARSGT